MSLDQNAFERVGFSFEALGLPKMDLMRYVSLMSSINTIN
jgi:hypothetical protein